MKQKSTTLISVIKMSLELNFVYIQTLLQLHIWLSRFSHLIWCMKCFLYQVHIFSRFIMVGRRKLMWIFHETGSKFVSIETLEMGIRSKLERCWKIQWQNPRLIQYKSKRYNAHMISKKTRWKNHNYDFHFFKRH